jgi:hypothetical protein
MKRTYDRLSTSTWAAKDFGLRSLGTGRILEWVRGSDSELGNELPEIMISTVSTFFYALLHVSYNRLLAMHDTNIS